MNAPNLTALSNGPLKPIMPGLVEIFQQSTGIQIEPEFAPGPVIAGRVTDGEVADVAYHGAVGHGSETRGSAAG